ncbi:nuclear transport factor 2 family protein [Hoeflea sp. YIM 152468]|uniref:nuclear transport factor 2 family protein n=1 Tax=Hoeflea sp. YIM 152468 TaxID=3031759 RepID=UPI0023DC8E63|nr:nuclear transport factor 2 family protein [Hoeflea sp. YIM 152468]MDF1610073.1 nuclear transport factor 2 family protein [Hoeflea sp. YIM 152468]
MSDAVRETLDRYYAALKAGDREALRSVVSDEIEVHYPAPEGLLPWAGDWTGFEEFETFIKTLGDHLVIDMVKPLSMHIAGDTVITVLKGEWTVKATARKVHTETVNLFTLRDGKIVRYQVFSDTAALAIGLGRLAA